MTPPTAAPSLELDRQVERYVEAGAPAATGLSDDAFRDLLAPLAGVLPDGPADDLFAVVLPPGLVPPLSLVAALRLRGKPGYSSMTVEEVDAFRPAVDVPAEPYLAVGLDTGPETLGVAPDDALPGLVARGRSPLTLEEGLALALHHPDVLVDRNCFELLGSRATSRRVTGLWVMKGGRPRLGWCWWGAPHTWLGMASCAARLTPAAAPAPGRAG